MSQETDSRSALSEALARVRALLEANVPATGLPAAPHRRLPWLCWITAAVALALAWAWPPLVDERTAPAARITGVFFALSAIVTGLFVPRTHTPTSTPHSAHTPQPVPAADPLSALSPNTPLRQLQARFALSDFEARTLLLCAAAELDPAVPDLLRSLQEGGLRQPTFALAHRLWSDGAWDALSENRPLLHWLLLEVRHQDGRPLAHSPLRLDDGVLQFLIGNPVPDARLLPYYIPFPHSADASLLSRTQAIAAQTLADDISETATEGEIIPVAALTGPFPLAQQLTALAVVAACGADACKLLRLPLSLLPTDPRDAEHLSRLWAREALLHGLALYVEADDSAEPSLRPALRRFFLAPRVLYFLASRENISGIPRAVIPLNVARPTAAEQQHAWLQGCARAGLDLQQADAMCLADQFHLDLPVILQAITSAQGTAFGDSAALRRHLQFTVRKENRSSLDLLAQRIEPRAAIDDLVLPAREKEQMEKFIAHVELRRLVFSEWGMGGHSQRGQGTAALFSGESGTGKTLAAEVIAARLGLDLYRIDLSAVVDKYIGETEKNLRRIFDAAESGGVILFFDEADALFGKRSEVKDSHDRYANIQINYLLQRLETYRGPAVLATNLGRSMDHAFLRRLRFIVRFPQPDREQRRQIWERSLAPLNDDSLPNGDPLLAINDRDFHAIAATALSGGEIRNAAIHAAFLAARRSGPVTRRIVEEAINDENQKAGRPATAGSNGHYA